jgi:hypothetical protein
MADPTPDTVAGPSNATGLASLLDALARFQSAALLYPPTHRRIAESSGALVEALRSTADLRGEVRFALSDGKLLRDGALVTDLAGPAKKLIADWEALGVARIAFLPHLVPGDLVAFARFLKEATTQIGSGHRPTLASFELVPPSIDIVSRDYGRPHREEEENPGDGPVPEPPGGGGTGKGGGTGDGVGRGRQRPPPRPIDDEELALREATSQRDAAVPEVPAEQLAQLLRVKEEAPPAPDDLAKDDRVATLTRIVHLLGRATPMSAGRAALEERLADLVAQHCGNLELDALKHGLTAMVHAGRARELAPLLDALGPALRRGAIERAAELLLLLLERQAQSPETTSPQDRVATRRVLWVHLAQEILLSIGAHGDAIERRAGRLLAQLDAAEYDAALAELAALRAIREKTFVKGALAPMRRELYGLYRALLRVGGPIADELATSFAQRPPATAAGGAFLALRDDLAGARAWLERFLAAQRAGKEDSELLSSAGMILRSFLETLAPGRRGEPWVASAVAALKRLSSPETDATLARIRHERRMLLLPGWPKACRDAAAGGAAR